MCEYKHCEECYYCRYVEEEKKYQCHRTLTEVQLEDSACDCFMEDD